MNAQNRLCSSLKPVCGRMNRMKGRSCFLIALQGNMSREKDTNAHIRSRIKCRAAFLGRDSKPAHSRVLAYLLSNRGSPTWVSGCNSSTSLIIHEAHSQLVPHELGLVSGRLLSDVYHTVLPHQPVQHTISVNGAVGQTVDGLTIF